MADTLTTTTTADPADQLLRLTAATRQAALDLRLDVSATSRLSELLDAVWGLQGVLDGFAAGLLDQALPREAVRLLLMQHWARDRQVRACRAGSEGRPRPEHDR